MAATLPYAAVATFEVQIENGTAVGYAAPASGPAPCLIALNCADTPIAYGRATHFSAAAEAMNLRMGWCGFGIPGLRQAFAIGERVQTVCAVSGRILKDIAADPALFATPLPSVQTLSAEDIVRLAQNGEVCESVDQLLPFALAHRQKHGDRATIEAAYQTLLRRWPDSGAPQSLDGPEELDVDARVLHMLKVLAQSGEYRQLWAAALPGPYHVAFRFDRTILGV